MFFARILAYAATKALTRQDSEGLGSPILYTVLVIVFQIFFMILGTMVVCAFSRFREFRADNGGARLVGRDKMIQALRALERTHEVKDPRARQTAFQAFKISDGRGFFRLFSTHPPLQERIARLEKGVM